MKKFIVLGLLLITLGICFSFKSEFIDLYYEYLYQYMPLNLKQKPKVTLGNTNEYFRDYNFKFVQNTKNFNPTNKQDIYNIYYTVINAGKKNFTFYCPEEYEGCIDEVKTLANDQTTLSHINNYVHPFNGFKHVETEYDSTGKVTIYIKRVYSEDMISKVTSKIQEIENEIFDDSLNEQDQIKKIHDYIINNSVYDSDRSDNNIVNYESDNAYGALLEGHALCGGYTDSMALFLNDLGIKNFKVSSDSHVWNAVLLNNQWYNLDLTWDDPVTPDKRNLLEYNYFLIQTEKLKTLSDNQHNFNASVYKEVA